MMDSDSFLDIEKVDLFEQLLRESGLPNFKRSGVSAMGNANAIKLPYATMEYNVKNNQYKGSQYFYKKRPVFLHFTSVTNAINILRDKSLRMYSLDSMSDSYELLALRNCFHKAEDYILKRFKQKVFSLSMCNVELEQKKQSLSAWRIYSEKGTGIAIEVEFERAYQGQWLNYMLSQVYYKSRNRQIAETIFQRYLEFIKLNNFEISNFNNIVCMLSAFHKMEPYMDEREVRLLYHVDTVQSSKKIKMDSRSNGKTAYYVELPLEYRAPKDFEENYPAIRRIIPYVKINRIICGPEMTQKSFFNTLEVIESYSSGFENPPIVVKSDLLD